MELTIALALFMVAAGTLSMAVAKSVSAQRTANSAQAVGEALMDDLNQIARSDYQDLLDDTYVIPNACDPVTDPMAPAIVGSDATGCLFVAGRNYKVNYSVFPGEDSFGQLSSAADHLYLQGTVALDDDVTVTQFVSVTAPFPGWSDTKATLHVSLTGAADEMVGRPIFLLDHADPSVTVGSARVRGDGSATIRPDVGSCSIATPCRLGLSPTDGFAVSGDIGMSATSVLGSGSTVVLHGSGSATAAAHLIERGRADIALEARPDVGITARNPHAGSVCLWASFNDGYTPREEPFCNTGNDPGEVVISDYAPDPARPNLRLLVPTGTAMGVSADRSDGACPSVPGMLGAYSTGWAPAAVCTTWTWGAPADFVSGSGDAVYFGEAEVTLEPGSTVQAQAVWAGTQARPATGYGAAGTWLKPRAPQPCSAEANCTRFGGAPIVPSDISGVAVWLDAASIDAASGSSVSTWTDRSGNGADGTQTTASKRPTLAAGVLNGRSVLGFNASTTQRMVVAGHIPAPWTVTYTARHTGGANQRILSGGLNNWLLGFWNGGVDKAYYDGWVHNPATTADTAWRTYTGDGTGAVSRIFSDGNLLATNGAGLSGPNGFSINAFWNGSVDSEHSNSQVAEIIAVKRVLTDAERVGLEAYLGDKWGTALTPETNACPNAHCFSFLNAAPVLSSPAGTHVVAAPASTTTAFNLTVTDPEASPITATILTLPGAGTLRHNGTPVPAGYSFGVQPSGFTAAMSYSAPAGTALNSFTVELSDGTASRTVEVGFAPSVRTWQIQGERSTITQGQTSPIRARVIGTDGNPRAGVTVTFTGAPSGVSIDPTTVVSDADGWVNVDATAATAPTGTGQLAVNAEGRSGTVTVDIVAAGGAPTVDIDDTTIAQGSTEAVTVSAPDRAGGAHAGVISTVVVEGAAGDSLARGIYTDQAGCYATASGTCTVTVVVSKDVPAGPYRLRATIDGETTDIDLNVVSAPVDLDAGTPGSPRVTVTQGGAPVPFTIDVFDGAGDPMAGVSIASSPPSGLTIGQDEASNGSGSAAFTIAAAVDADSGRIAVPIVAGGAQTMLWVEVVGVVAEAEPVAASVPSGSDGVVRLLVLDAAGKPISGVPVEWRPPAGTSFKIGFKSSSNEAGSAQTLVQVPPGSPTGTFNVRAIVPGVDDPVDVPVTVTAGM